MADELVPNREIIKNAVLRSESFTTSGFVQSKMFRSCRFVETDFFSIRFEHCDFFDCVFENVDMSGSVFRRCSFAECSLLRSNFNHSRFESCHFGNADGEGTKISSSNFTQAEFTGDPVHNRMDRVLFEHCSLDFARFVAFSPFGVEFVDCNLQEALIERCRSERIDVRTCSCRGLQLRDNELGAFVSYKEKFIRTIGVAALIGACDLDIDGSALRLGKQTERDDLAAVAEAVQRLRDEAADAGRLFEQINSEIILRTIQDRYSISKRERGSITSNVVTTQLEKRVVGMPIQISDVTLAILAL